jgi:hypothetical protein
MRSSIHPSAICGLLAICHHAGRVVPVVRANHGKSAKCPTTCIHSASMAGCYDLESGALGSQRRLAAGSNIESAKAIRLWAGGSGPVWSGTPRHLP